MTNKHFSSGSPALPGSSSPLESSSDLKLVKVAYLLAWLLALMLIAPLVFDSLDLELLGALFKIPLYAALGGAFGALVSRLYFTARGSL